MTEVLMVRIARLGGKLQLKKQQPLPQHPKQGFRLADRGVLKFCDCPGLTEQTFNIEHGTNCEKCQMLHSLTNFREQSQTGISEVTDQL